MLASDWSLVCACAIGLLDRHKTPGFIWIQMITDSIRFERIDPRTDVDNSSTGERRPATTRPKTRAKYCPSTTTTTASTPVVHVHTVAIDNNTSTRDPATAVHPAVYNATHRRQHAVTLRWSVGQSPYNWPLTAKVIVNTARARSPTKRSTPLACSIGLRHNSFIHAVLSPSLFK